MRNLCLALLALLSLTACDNNPVFHGLTQQEKDEYAQRGLTDIYEGDRLLQSFNDYWQEGSPELLAVFRFGL